MIVRYTLACSICKHAITLRIQVGHRPYQEHAFQCPECGEDISIGMHCDARNASVEICEIENVEASDEEGTIVNLSPDFTIAEEDLHKDRVFPSLQHAHAFFGAQQRFGFDPSDTITLEELRKRALNFRGFPENWNVVKTAWSLTAKGKEHLAAQHLAKYVSQKFDGPYKLNFVLFDFCCRFLNRGRYYLFDQASDLAASIAKKHVSEFQRFRHYYISEVHADNLARYYDVFCEYFACYGDFGQAVMFVQNDMEMPPDHQATSIAFAKTKSFYGNAFEALTENIAVLACLNNIDQNRSYNQFQSMDLSKYMKIHKAKRAEPFKETQQFYALAKPLDSTLRNASHHGSMRLLPGGRNIEFRSGGTGALQRMTYREYIEKCNEIMISCCALLALELGIAF